MTHLCSLQPTDRWNFEFLKIKMAAAAILENRKIAISQQRLYWSTQNSVRWCRISPLTTRSLKNLNSKVPDSGRPPFWKPLNRNISSSVWPFWWNVEWWRLLAPRGRPTVIKISNFWKWKMAARRLTFRNPSNRPQALGHLDEIWHDAKWWSRLPRLLTLQIVRNSNAADVFLVF